MCEAPESEVPGNFPPTQWTKILTVIQLGDADEAWKALEMFCQSYRPAIVNFFQRRGCSPADAEEFTQEFFLTRIHERWDVQEGFLFKAGRSEKSKFRCFLSTALRRFLVDQWRKKNRHLPDLGLDPLESNAQLPSDINAETIYRECDRAVAVQTIQKAIDRTNASKLHIAHFQNQISQRDAALAMDISEDAFKQSYRRFRERLAKELWEEVSQQVGPDKSEIEAEIKYLMSLFASLKA